METMCAPWRMEYLMCEKPEGCVFCKRSLRCEDYVLFDGKTCFVMLNRYPYVNGHLMIIPIRHLGDIAGLTVGEREEIFSLVDITMGLACSSAHGFDQQSATIECKINYIRTVSDGEVICHAKVLNAGRKVHVLEARALQGDKLVATAQGCAAIVGVCYAPITKAFSVPAMGGKQG